MGPQRDKLQPLNVSAYKPAKGFVGEPFKKWYSGEVQKHLEADR